VSESIKFVCQTFYSKIHMHMKASKEIEPVEVFAGTAWQADMVKSLLANAAIEAFLVDEILGTLSPWWTSPGGSGAVKVFVSNMDYDRAKLVVDEYQDNLRENG
jgi:hypothetical protein